MKTTLLASALGFPRGPVVMSRGRVVLCDGNTGELLVCADGSVRAAHFLSDTTGNSAYR